MCGIAGFVRRAGTQPGDEALLRAMCDAIAHRGPDDDGRQIIGAAALGMRRLSIIDVAGGHQPIANETGDVTVVYNGEIYNYQRASRAAAEGGPPSLDAQRHRDTRPPLRG